MHDVVVIGAGPVGLACAIEARREGLTARVIEKGTLVNSIVGYPARMEFFSTPELIEIGNYPFPIQGYKPTREDAVEYYRGVAAQEKLDVRLYERVLDVRGAAGDFTVTTSKGTHQARHIVVSIGFFDQPNLLNVPGENLPKVTHYYREPYPFVRQKVAVIGARNSAAKAALDCYRHGAEVTLIVRSNALSDKIKYWIKPDLENRIRAGAIRAFFRSRVVAIAPGAVSIETPAGPETVPADAVFPLIGYEPDFALFERCGIRTEGDNRVPVHDPATLESNVPGIYLAGALLGGVEVGRIFIENSRHHAAMIADGIARKTTLDPAIATFLPEFRASPGSDPDR